MQADSKLTASVHLFHPLPVGKEKLFESYPKAKPFAFSEELKKSKAPKRGLKIFASSLNSWLSELSLPQQATRDAIQRMESILKRDKLLSAA